MDTDKKPTVDTLEDEIDAIRIKLYEQTKDMTRQERVAFINKGAREIIKEYGLTNVKIIEAPPASDTPAPQP